MGIFWGSKLNLTTKEQGYNVIETISNFLFFSLLFGVSLFLLLALLSLCHVVVWFGLFACFDSVHG